MVPVLLVFLEEDGALLALVGVGEELEVGAATGKEVEVDWTGSSDIFDDESTGRQLSVRSRQFRGW